MEFTTIFRKELYKQFYTSSQKVYNTKDVDNQFIYQNFFKCFKNTTKITEGAEGIVYKASLDDFKSNIIIKISDLKKIFETKGLNKDILNRNPLDIYSLFNKLHQDKSLSYLMTLLIETLTYTLTNQFIFQNICPHFSINYYWEYEDNILLYYNEYANSSTLYDWLLVPRTEEEYFNMFIQVIISIICMQKYFNMIHGDLHSKNILVQKVPKGGFWKYIINDKLYIVPNLGWVFITSDYGFTTIPDKIYVDWYYDESIKPLSPKGKQFYDFMYLIVHTQDRIVLNVSKNIISFLNNIISKYKLNTYKYKQSNINVSMQDILNEFYKNYKYSSNNFIEIYDLDKKLNKELLPDNFKDLSIF